MLEACYGQGPALLKRDKGKVETVFGHHLPGFSDVPSLIIFLCVHSAAKPSLAHALQARSMHS